jgi:hypothetical protein
MHLPLKKIFPAAQAVQVLKRPSSSSISLPKAFFEVSADFRTLHEMHPFSTGPQEHEPTADGSVGVASSVYVPLSQLILALHFGPEAQVNLPHLMQTPAEVASTIDFKQLPRAFGGLHWCIGDDLSQTPPSAIHARPLLLSPTASNPTPVHTEPSL